VACKLLLVYCHHSTDIKELRLASDLFSVICPDAENPLEFFVETYTKDGRLYNLPQLKEEWHEYNILHAKPGGRHHQHPDYTHPQVSG
jgi:hypothetical protein